MQMVFLCHRVGSFDNKPITLEGNKVPRSARKRSETSVYHIMMRGNNRQKIFNNVEDKDRTISHTVKRIGTSYAWFYNKKYVA